MQVTTMANILNDAKMVKKDDANSIEDQLWYEKDNRNQSTIIMEANIKPVIGQGDDFG